MSEFGCSETVIVTLNKVWLRLVKPNKYSTKNNVVLLKFINICFHQLINDHWDAMWLQQDNEIT